MKQISFLFFFMIITSLANANNNWSTNGPYGGYFQSFVFHPEQSEVIFASGFDGFFRSGDSGLTWERLNLPGGEYNARIHPRNPGVILAANFSDGLFQSTDLGNSWERIFEYPFDEDCFYDMEFHPSESGTLFAVTFHHGVYKSTDGGRNWSPGNSGLNLTPAADCCLDIPQLEIDPSNGNVVYALMPNRLVYRSTNGGKSWQSASKGLNFKKEVHALAIDPKDSRVLYAGGAEGIFRTDNNGKKWTSKKCGCYVWDIEVDPVDHKTLYGVGESGLKSTDSGKKWDWFSPHPYLSDVMLGIGIHPKNPRLIFAAGFGGGIFRSDNGGRTWKTVNERLDALNVLQLKASPGEPSRILAVGGLQAFESRDGGQTWDLFMKSQLSTFRVANIVVHPQNRKLIVVAGNRTTSGALNITTDGGQTWEVKSEYPGVNYGCTACVALDPQDQNIIYLTPFFKEKGNAISLGAAKSKDQGKTWSLINNGLTKKDIWLIAVHPKQSRLLFAGTGSGKMFRSPDGGEHWEDSGNGLDNTSIRSIAFDSVNPGVIYTATYSGLFKSVDGGKNWVLKSQGLPESWFNFIGLDPVSSNTLYAAGGAGIFESRDGGESWTSSQLGTPGPFAVWNLLIIPNNPPVFYAGTDRGVFRFTMGK